ncbi:hypothetical protein PILCRDRAFT_821909 [Piloderma croceum F 1598]|uniref:Uncharacterized protein n=1 Tax=Piloderma croceum (strain F 1598) TaxID=765440 RepID=A0A0C3FP94_PILCF|nr:hypothetical protein PILCRDRAFT_821909 [Piloderma croceum F 1598]
MTLFFPIQLYYLDRLRLPIHDITLIFTSLAPHLTSTIQFPFPISNHLYTGILDSPTLVGCFTSLLPLYILAISGL